MSDYGGYEISWFGLLLTLEAIGIFTCMKIETRWNGRYIFTILCTIALALCIVVMGAYNVDTGRYGGQARTSALYIHLRDRRQAIQNYVRDHGQLPMEEPLLLSLAPYFQDNDQYSPVKDWIVTYFFLKVTPNATWMGCDLAECLPVETWWDRLWQSNSYNIAIREGLERIAARFHLYGSKNTITPPESDAVRNLYKAEDDAIWLLVDHLFEEGVEDKGADI